MLACSVFHPRFPSAGQQASASRWCAQQTACTTALLHGEARQGVSQFSGGYLPFLSCRRTRFSSPRGPGVCLPSNPAEHSVCKYLTYGTIQHLHFRSVVPRPGGVWGVCLHRFRPSQDRGGGEGGPILVPLCHSLPVAGRNLQRPGFLFEVLARLCQPRLLEHPVSPAFVSPGSAVQWFSSESDTASIGLVEVWQSWSGEQQARAPSFRPITPPRTVSNLQPKPAASLSCVVIVSSRQLAFSVDHLLIAGLGNWWVGRISGLQPQWNPVSRGRGRERGKYGGAVWCARKVRLAPWYRRSSLPFGCELPCLVGCCSPSPNRILHFAGSSSPFEHQLREFAGDP